MRGFIRQGLESDYKILEAEDGEQGVNTAFDTIPDLIVSDVMMPKMNGFQVCQTLKTDERTSHVPIILLTAKAEAENKIEGLETGADDYLLKPFYTKELKIRIQNLIRIRRKLRLRFSKMVVSDFKDVGISSVDQSFLEKVINIIQNHLPEVDFNVDELGRETGMSSSTLRRKFRGLLNQSPNQFIRTIRLQQAKQMLENKSGNIAEIAFAVGFEDPSYFAQCFRDYFGVLPSEVKK